MTGQPRGSGWRLGGEEEAKWEWEKRSARPVGDDEEEAAAGDMLISGDGDGAGADVM